jgi:uncharacterized RmlC-like cupin family protein
MSTQLELKSSIALPSGATVVRENDRLYDSEHGYLRGWGLTGKTAGSKQLSMAHGIIPPHISAKPHYHPFETAIFVLTGNCRVFWGADAATSTDIEAGDFLYIPKGVIHCPANVGEATMEYVVARSSPEEVCLYPKEELV